MMTDLRTVDLLDDGKALSVSWTDGREARFHALWLRDNAMDEATRSPANGQRLITIRDVPETTSISKAVIVGHELDVLFAPEGKQVNYAGDWLHAHAYDLNVEPTIADLPPAIEIWDGTLDPEDVTLSFNAVMEQQSTLCSWLAYVRRYGFARLTDGPVENGALFQIVEQFGYVRETNYGRWFEVRTEINPSNLAYTRLGLQAHTDNPYRDPVPTLQILCCLENAAQGGDSQVVDGFGAARRLQAIDPKGFALLSGYPARFAYEARGKVSLHTRKPMIELDCRGRLAAIRFNNRSTAPIMDVPYDDMLAYYRAYRKFSEIIDDPAMAVTFKLEPGDGFIVDNTRVLHGRTGYLAEAGSRWLQGCYADKDGLLSTLMILEQQEERTTP